MNRLVGPIAALAAMLWFTAPCLPGYSIGGAINNRDTTTLEQRVSWPAVRQGSKGNLDCRDCRGKGRHEGPYPGGSHPD
jgi:hypothetical protein